MTTERMMKQARRRVRQEGAQQKAPKAPQEASEKGGAYILRDLDPTLWRLVKGKAALEGVTLKATIEGLLRQWVAQA